MKKKTNQVPEPAETASSGGFAAGFFLGVLGGALGTLLFSTDKGKKVLQRLREEFEPTLESTLESAEVQSLVDEYRAVKEEVSTAVSEAKKKFPKFSAHQSKKS